MPRGTQCSSHANSKMTKKAPNEPLILNVATYNLHKGLSLFNKRLIVDDVRHHLHNLAPDLVFLQEVQGHHTTQAVRFENWPKHGHHEHIAGGRWQHTAYGKNANYDAGHHGNALLSTHPILRWKNHDVSHHRFENRGHLHASIAVPGLALPLHTVCVHLGLLASSREAQINSLIRQLKRKIEVNAPLIIAGDFNDWRGEKSGISARLEAELGLQDAFAITHGNTAATFPAFMPMLKLDRVYTRGFEVQSAERLANNSNHKHWQHLSDHAGLLVRLCAKKSTLTNAQ